MHRIRLVREALGALIENPRKLPDIDVRLIASMGELAQHEGVAIALAVMDIDGLSPDDSAFGRMLADLRATFGDSCPVLAISEREDSPDEALTAIRRGANGLFPASLGTAMLLAAIRLILAGGIFVSPEALRGTAQRHDSPMQPFPVIGIPTRPRHS